jgi:hypothetical protein
MNKMSTLVKITLTLTIFLFGISESNAQWGNKKVVGSGNITTKTVSTPSYDKIKAVGSMDVHLESGNEGTITITTDDNLQEYIMIEVENDVLTLRTKKNVNLKTKKGIHISVPFQDISAVSLVGSGDIDTKDTINGEALEVTVTGSGDVVLDLVSITIDAKITGSGDMTLSGTVKDFEVKLSGSGDFKGSDLKAENTQAYVSGSGDAAVYASNSLKARVNGSGDIKYSGNPNTSDTKVLGSGSISSN